MRVKLGLIFMLFVVSLLGISITETKAFSERERSINKSRANYRGEKQRSIYKL